MEKLLSKKNLMENMTRALLIAITFLTPVLIFAQNTPFETTDTGFVGCTGVGGNGGTECNWTTFLALIARVMRNAYIFGFFVLIIMIAYAGFLLLTSGGSADKKNSAKSVVKGVVIGMIVMFFSYAIVIYILNTLGVDKNFFQLLEF